MTDQESLTPSQTPAVPPEFSRPLAVDQVNKPTERTLKAEAGEREALARRFGLIALNRLEARVRVKPTSGGKVIRVDGRVEGDVVQTCGVTLDPVASTVVEDFALAFAVDPQKSGGAGREVLLAVDEDDPPEPVIDGVIDLGEVVAEHLALALDPFPRKPDAEFVFAAAGDDGAEEEKAPAKPNPFAVLAKLGEGKGK